MPTITDLNVLKINYLTQQQYDDAVNQGTINPNELYLTPASGSGVSDVMVDGVSVVLGGVAYVDLTGKQDILVSGTNIKTVNGVSLLGSGNIVTPDDDTTYTFSISGHTLTITPSTGSPTTLSLPDNNTTYSISGSGDTITLTGSDGSTSIATISDDDTTYTLSKSGNTITLTGSDGSTTSVTDANDNTTYTISISGNVLTLTPSTGTPQTITLPDDDTTYTISVSGNNLTLTPSSGTAQTITLPIPTKTSDLTNDSDFVSDANYVHTDNNFTTAEKNKLSGIEAGAEVNVQANWNQSDSTADDYIKNKPTIPTPPSPSSTTPLMDGTASVGSETNYARGDHRHPADTSKQDALVSGTNIKTINGNSILGSGDLQVGGLDMFYPVGSYYETSDTTFNPNVAWGGTWALETEGQVHVSAGANYTVGDTGGTTTHTHTTGNFTLTSSHIPSHAHSIASNGNGLWVSNSGANSRSRVASNSSGALYVLSESASGKYTWQTTTASTGSGGAHNHGNTGDGSNMQPYIVVNRWHRTA